MYDFCPILHEMIQFNEFHVHWCLTKTTDLGFTALCPLPFLMSTSNWIGIGEMYYLNFQVNTCIAKVKPQKKRSTCRKERCIWWFHDRIFRTANKSERIYFLVIQEANHLSISPLYNILYQHRIYSYDFYP